MNKVLLVSDTHFTDNPDDEYRWELFPILSKIIDEKKIDEVFFLGDLSDRKDRHSGNLLNRLSASIDGLNTQVKIIMGNHDAPVSEESTPYWFFLNSHLNVQYYTEPFGYKNCLFLPYTAKPMQAWSEIDYSKFNFIFLHQPIKGAVTDSGYVLESGSDLPLFPRKCKVYAGDIHRPQTVSNVTYIGSPYPVKFEENFNNRVVVIDLDEPKYFEEIPLRIIRKEIIEVASEEEFVQKLTSVKAGDQIRIRFKLDVANLNTLAQSEEKLKQLATTNNLKILSFEPLFIASQQISKEQKQNTQQLTDPKEILKVYCQTENASQELFDIGLEILEKASR